MNKTQLTVIARAISCEQEIFPLNQSWQAIHREYNIGLTQAKKLHLTSADKQELRELVNKITGIDLQQVGMGEFSTMQREQVLTLAIDEKLAGQSVKKSRLAMKPVPGRMLKLNGEHYRLPDHSHCDIALDNITSIEHQSIWVVENYRCFDQLSAMKLDELAASTEPLVVFRGDQVYQAGTVLSLIEKYPLPVWVMGDMDPKGLSIAQSFPNFAGLIGPGLAALEFYFKNSGKANHKIYEKQLAGCRMALSDTRYPIIQACWQLMKLHQAGIVQEHWLVDNTSLKMHPA
ncbi:DUF7281 domain-containing protein [Methylomonas sp. 11b]|uniref:DUF7281 domain-containing protein n=1 Tax=Methylomonas sp. 11b TaxID=1168169 RepID=UPI000478F5AC|nr:DUF2399 domain-containing protein [Methylomonas sp. 11b]OQW66719.1 MAG: hypothetical protein BVN35_21455 [Proteobacteria bacterium ST_bin11]